MKGVLLVNLGTPDDPSRGAVYRYLKQFLLDRRVIDYAWLPRNLLVRGIIAPFRSGSSAKLYQRLWTEEGSPIKIYGYKLRDGVQEILGDHYKVELAMRYQSPSIENGLNSLIAAGVEDILVVPLFPHYASATVGSVHDEVMRIMRKREVIPTVKFINSYHDNEEMIDVFVDHAKRYELDDYDHFVFSYHGLPQRQLRKADDGNHCLAKKDCCSTLCAANTYCYSAQCHDTSRLIAEKMGIKAADYTVCFQSRLGPEQWTKPYTSEVISDQLKEGNKNLLVFSPAFVADCLETTIEIGYEYKEEFEEEGGEKLDLVESLNDDPRWFMAVANIVRSHTERRIPTETV